MAITVALYRIVLTEARPSRVQPLPRSCQLPWFRSATPTRAAHGQLLKRPGTGGSATSTLATTGPPPGTLRSWLEDEGLHHVLAVPCNEDLGPVPTSGAWTRCTRSMGTGNGAGATPVRGTGGNVGTAGSAGPWLGRTRRIGTTTCSSGVPAPMRTTGRSTWPWPRRAATWRLWWAWPAAA